jgi:hypothetical protein
MIVGIAKDFCGVLQGPASVRSDILLHFSLQTSVFQVDFWGIELLTC